MPPSSLSPAPEPVRLRSRRGATLMEQPPSNLVQMDGNDLMQRLRPKSLKWRTAKAALPYVKDWGRLLDMRSAGKHAPQAQSAGDAHRQNQAGSTTVCQ